jgi:hypothetical protein
MMSYCKKHVKTGESNMSKLEYRTREHSFGIVPAIVCWLLGVPLSTKKEYKQLIFGLGSHLVSSGHFTVDPSWYISSTCC